jgi:hypothetical protein
VQAQDFHTPAYSETDVTNGGFGLNYAAMNATDVRTRQRRSRIIASAALSLPVGYAPAMTNAFGVVLDSASVRRAAVRAMPETVIAAIYVLHENSVDAVASTVSASL